MGKKKGEQNDTLTRIENQFVAAYEGNGAEAVRQTDSRSTNPTASACNLLKRPRVQKAIAAKNKAFTKGIEKGAEKSGERFAVTVNNVLKELARLAFFDARKLFTDDGKPKSIVELDDDTAASIAGLDVEEVFDGRGEDRVQTGVIKKWKIADKGQNLERLAKHLGMFIERHVNLPSDFLSRGAEDQEYFCNHGCYPEDDLRQHESGTAKR